ncbi:LysR family transcriptional regulator, partial [Limosilactobacillus reuteri]
LNVTSPLKQSFRLSAVTRSTELLTASKQKLWDLLTTKKE